MVTHDVQEAFELGHKICLMDKGKIIQMGSPKEILYQPKNEFVKNFFSENRLLLEYKVATLKDIKTEIDFKHLYEKFQFSENTNLWVALQKLSSDQLFSKDYENLVKAFNDYRKLPIV